MKKLLIILFTVFFSTNFSVVYSKGEKYIDDDWNMTFYNHCGFPSSEGKKQNVKWVKKDENKFLRFLLYNGQVGKCSNDDKKRIKGEPYTERADIKQWSKLEKGSQYEISFRFRIVEGFKSKKEKFFKISSQGSKSFNKCSKTLLFLQFSGRNNPKGLRLHLLDLTSNQQTFKKYKLEHNHSKIQVHNLYNKWIKLKFLINFKEKDAEVDLFFNEEKIVNRFKFDVPCNDVKMSIGLERHGSLKKKHALSVIDYDKLIVNKTNL